MNEPTKRERKISQGDWQYAEEWKRHIWDAHPKIPKECRLPILKLFCLAQLQNSAAGLDCFTSNAKVADMMAIDRRYLKKYRWLATELEWLIPNGIVENRVPHLQVNIPAFQRDVIELPEEMKDKDNRTRREPRASVANKAKVPEMKPEPIEPDPWADNPIKRQVPAQASTEPASPFDQDES